MNFKVLISAIFACVFATVGCSDDSNNAAGSGGTAGSGGAGGSGGVAEPKDCDDVPEVTGYIVPNAPATSKEGCTVTLNPTGTDDHVQILNALVDTDFTNGALCLGVGTWDMGNTIGITDDPGMTLKGLGDSPDEVVLDYADSEGTCRGTKGINVGVDNVTIENLWVKNSCANGVEQADTDGSVFRKVMVSWDGDPDTGEPITANGAYGIYPTDCSNTLVEYCQVQGASDAGIYIGKCTGGLVENNIVYENVAGLEVENCVDVDASNNSAFDNVGGLFALQQDISSDMQANNNVRIFDNESYCNNHENFALEGSAVAGIPVGTGILSFAGDGVEIFDNDITDNLTLGIGMASNLLNCQVAGADCPEYSPGYDPYVKNNYIHDNRFTNNGTNPQGQFGTLFKLLGFGSPGDPPVPDVVWDGYKEDPADQSLCLGTDAAAAATVLVIGDVCKDPINPEFEQYITCATTNASTDQTPYLCVP